MPDWHALLTSEAAQGAAIGVGSFAGLIGAAYAAYKGARQGRPTSAAAVAAIAAAPPEPPCRVAQTGPAFEAVRADLAAIREALGELREEQRERGEAMRDLLVKIEDRTARRG